MSAVGGKEEWGALGKGLLKIPSTPYLCDQGPISVLIFERQRPAFCFREKRMLCALLRCHIHFYCS